MKAEIAVDGVIIGMPSRLLDNDPSQAPPEAGQITAFQETSIAVWDGDPLGVRCKVQTAQVPFDGLPLDLTFDLPTKADKPALPPKLRFGAPYWLGARTVLLGGVALPLKKATPLYDASDSMALPKPSEWRRFLRHEWIDAPMVATPWEEVQREFQTDGRGGLDGEWLVVRSLDPKDLEKSQEKDEDKRRYGPSRTSRVLFAPRVDFNFAHLHGVFDPGPNAADPNEGGLKGVDFDGARGGFPAFPTEQPPLSKNIHFNDSMAIKHDDGALCAIGGGDTPPTPASGLAIFRPRTVSHAGVPSEHLYFPDPAARQIAIALRRPWRPGFGEFLDGTPILIPLYPNHADPKEPKTPGYPDAVAIIVTVQTMLAGKDAPLTAHEQILKRAHSAKGYSQARIDPNKSATGDNLALEVTIPLLPGEDFELVAWAVPERAHIGAWFDAPESLAFLSDASHNLESLSLLAPSALSEVMTTVATTTQGGPYARREDATVSMACVRAAAQSIHDALMRRPIPEFAAPRRLRVTHASEKPAVAPEIVTRSNLVGPDATPRALETVVFRRLNKDNRDAVLAGGPLGDDDDVDATTLLLDADVMVDRNTVDAIELRVTAASPIARPLDNVLLGRTSDDRIRGDWPNEPTNKGPDALSPGRLLYGFDVYADGRVEIPNETVLMQRWRIHPDEGGPNNRAISLLALSRFAKSDVSDPKDKQTAELKRADALKRSSADESLFADGTARRVSSQILASSRTARLIPDREIYPDEVQQRTDAQRRHLPSALQPTSIIRSVVRPALPPVRSVLPAFVWTEPVTAGKNIVAKSRTTRIRIPFSRPGMTSGVEERLGIVLWPPNIVDAWIDTGEPWDVVRLGRGEIKRAEPLSPTDSKIFDLQELSNSNGPDWRRGFFTDADLGAGGPFITRWGADPIHPEGELSWFIGLNSFKDLPYWKATAIDSIAAEDKDTGLLWPEEDIYRPRLVENVLMPLPKTSENAGGTDGNVEPATLQRQQFMMVSLLTYAPRFDVDSERWYVDVEIDPGNSPDPFLRLGLVRFQPHASRELQVSFPTTEWVQIVGRQRDVTVVVQPGDKPDDYRAIVTVESPLIDKIDSNASTVRHVVTSQPAAEPKPGLSIPEAPVTVLRATLIERVRTDAGYVIERTARPDGADGNLVGSPDTAPTTITQETGVRYGTLKDGAQQKGQVTLKLPRAYCNKSSGDTSFSQYAVFVEEVLRMRRGDFESEPLTITQEQGADLALWRDSGPRFSVKLDVPVLK